MTSQPGRSRRKAVPPRATLPVTPRADLRKDAKTGSPVAPGRAALADFVGPATPGLVAFGVGAVLLILAFTVLPWYGTNPGLAGFGGGHWAFWDVHHVIDGLKAQTRDISRYVSFGLADVLFGWRGIVLVVATLVFGGLSVSRFGSPRFYLKWLAAVLSFTGAAISLAGLKLITLEGNPPANATPPAFKDYVEHAGIGAWAAMVGFLAVLTAVFLPRHDRSAD